MSSGSKANGPITVAETVINPKKRVPLPHNLALGWLTKKLTFQWTLVLPGVDLERESIVPKAMWAEGEEGKGMQGTTIHHQSVRISGDLTTIGMGVARKGKCILWGGKASNHIT